MRHFVQLTDAISGNPVIIKKKEILTVLQVGGSDVHLTVSKVFTKQGQNFEVSETTELIYELLEPDLAKKQSDEVVEEAGSDFLGLPISSLGLPAGTTYTLETHCAPPATISNLLKFSEEELTMLPRIGSAAVKAIKIKLKEVGFYLRA